MRTDKRSDFVCVPEHPAVRGKLFDLASRATYALGDEDVILGEAMGNSRRKSAYARCAHGLSYWVFEHNLVFPIFRDWVRTEHVFWDARPVKPDALSQPRPADPLGKRAETRKSTSAEKSSTASYIDLQVVRGRSTWRFEAKWWNSGTAKSILAADAKKLRDARQSETDRSFLITFWCGLLENVPNELAKAKRDAAREPSVQGTLAFSGHFPSIVYDAKTRRRRDDGYFMVGVFELLPLVPGPLR